MRTQQLCSLIYNGKCVRGEGANPFSYLAAHYLSCQLLFVVFAVVGVAVVAAVVVLRLGLVWM